MRIMLQCDSQTPPASCLEMLETPFAGLARRLTRVARGKHYDAIEVQRACHGLWKLAFNMQAATPVESSRKRCHIAIKDP